MDRIALVIMVAVAATAFAGALWMLWAAHRERTAARRRLVAGSLAATPEPEQKDAAKVVGAVRRIGEALASGGYSGNLRRTMSAAGFHGASAPAVFMGTKAVLLVLGLAGGVVFVLQAAAPLPLSLALATMLAGVLFLLPNYHVARRRSKRCGETHRYLPDATDLLEICVSSGMGLDQAWNSVADEVRRVSPVLSDEMELTSLEIGLGVERSVAMRNMAERTGAEEISSLVALMIQADRFGASIVDALRTFATSMRETSSRRAEEAAEKMAVKLLAPMILFIFPALLIVMVGPAVMRIVDVMG